MNNIILTSTIGKLNTLSSYLKDRANEEWSAILLGMIGSCYCLYETETLTFSERRYDLLIEEGKQLLAIMKEGLEIEKAAQREFQCWFAGYYLNGAELRIQSSLHRLLKLFCGIDDKKRRGSEIKDLLELFHKHQYYNCSPEISQLLSDLRENYRDGSCSGNYSAACLRRVWKRVNDIKHRTDCSELDILNPRERLTDAQTALLALIAIYVDLAHQKHIVTENIL